MEEFGEVFRKYDNKELEHDECAKQLRAVLLKLLNSDDVTGSHRENIKTDFLAIDRNLENYKDATRRKKAGVPGADENLKKVSYDLGLSIETIRDLMMDYIKKEKSTITPTFEPKLKTEPEIDTDDKTEKQYLERIKSTPDDDTAYNALGNYYFSKRRYEDAIKQYEKAIAKNENLVYYSNIGDAYNELRKWDESILFYEKALNISLDDDIINNKLGVIYYQQREYEKAKDYYLAAIRKNPEPLYYVNIGLNCTEQKRYDEAIQYYENALTINPEYAVAHAELAWAKLSKYYSEGKSDRTLLQDALVHYKESIRIDPNKFDYFHYCGLGEVYWQLENMDKAIECFERSIELGPDHSRAYNGLGNVYFAKKDYHKALEYYLEAQKKDPNNYFYAENIGNCYKQLKEWDQAITHYKKALELNPRDDITISFLGEIYYQINEYEKAGKYFEEAMSINSNNDLHQYWMGMIFSAQAQWDNATSYFKKAIELNPQNDYSLYELSFVYFNKGLLRESVELLLKAVNVRPTDPLYYDKLSLIYSRLKKWNEAEKYAKLADEKARAINQNDDSYRRSLALVYNEKGLQHFHYGQYQEAIEEYRKALNIKEDATYYWNIYMTYKKLNDLKEAKKFLVKAIQLKPDEHMYIDELEKL